MTQTSFFDTHDLTPNDHLNESIAHLEANGYSIEPVEVDGITKYRVTTGGSWPRLTRTMPADGVIGHAVFSRYLDENTENWLTV